MSRQTRSAGAGVGAGAARTNEPGSSTDSGTLPKPLRLQDIDSGDEDQDSGPVTPGQEHASEQEDYSQPHTFRVRIAPTVDLQLQALRDLAAAPPPVENTALDDAAQEILSKAVGLILALRRQETLAAGDALAVERTREMLAEVTGIRRDAAADIEDLGMLIEVQQKRKRAETLSDATRNVRSHSEHYPESSRSRSRGSRDPRRIDWTGFLRTKESKCPSLTSGEPRAYQDWKEQLDSIFRVYFGESIEELGERADVHMNVRILEFLCQGLADVSSLKHTMTTAVRDKRCTTWTQFEATLKANLTPERMTSAQLLDTFLRCRQGQLSLIDFKAEYHRAHRDLPDYMKPELHSPWNQHPDHGRLKAMYYLFNRFSKPMQNALSSYRKEWPQCANEEALWIMAREMEAAGHTTAAHTAPKEAKGQKPNATTSAPTSGQGPNTAAVRARGRDREAKTDADGNRIYTAEQTARYNKRMEEKAEKDKKKSPATGVNASGNAVGQRK